MPTATATRAKAVKTADGYLNVELVRVGKWSASRGDGTVTAEDIAAMAQAFNDPLADRIPIKLGHSDSRFQDAEGNPPSMQDGSPAYGRVENVRVSDDGQTLLGDLVAMPSLLADVADSAYPDRSVEFVPGKRLGGKVYRAVLTGLALLGKTPPAVKGLNDLYAKFAEQLVQPIALHIVDDTPTIHHSQQIPADGAGSTPTRNPGGPVPISAAVRTALAIPDNATDDQINEALAAAGIAALPAVAPAAVPVIPSGPVIEAPAGVPLVPAGTATIEGAPPATPELVAASAGADSATIVVDRAAFSALQSDAQAGRVARETQIAQHRDQLVATALREGRIAPIVTQHYRNLLDKDETGTAALLTALPQILPTAEIGHGGQQNLSADDAQAKHARARSSFLPKGN